MPAAKLPFHLKLIYGLGDHSVNVALVSLTVIPSLLAKTVFGAGAPWLIVLAVNLVYAVAATGVWVGAENRRTLS